MVGQVRRSALSNSFNILDGVLLRGISLVIVFSALCWVSSGDVFKMLVPARTNIRSD